jgi:hypothetical protein
MTTAKAKHFNTSETLTPSGLARPFPIWGTVSRNEKCRRVAPERLCTISAAQTLAIPTFRKPPG